MDSFISEVTEELAGMDAEEQLILVLAAVMNLAQENPDVGNRVIGSIQASKAANRLIEQAKQRPVPMPEMGP